jgi:hypothetical protein
VARTSSSERGVRSASGGGIASAEGGYPGRRALGRRGGRRPGRVALIVLGVVAFLAVSTVLARFFAAENIERDHELLLFQAEAKGDVAGMLAQLSGCGASARCVAGVRSDAALLRRGGAVQILSTQSSKNHSLTGSVGETRVAWKVSGRYPVVQCVRVRRGGNFLTGISIALVAVSARLPGTADC